MGVLRWLGRVFLAPVFIVSGFDAAGNPGGRVAKAAALGVPYPELAVRANGATMVVAGAALALGIKPRLAALILAAAMAPTTLAGHAFWDETDEAARKAQRTQFLKNLGLIGGLLVLLGAEGRRSA